MEYISLFKKKRINCSNMTSKSHYFLRKFIKIQFLTNKIGDLSTLRTIDHELVNNTPVHELVNKKKIKIFSVHKNFQKFFDHKNCDLKKFMRSKTNFCEQSKNYAINKKIMRSFKVTWGNPVSWGFSVGAIM